MAVRRMSYLQENNFIGDFPDSQEDVLTPIPSPHKISVVVTPASINSKEDFSECDVDDLCQKHNTKCYLWCKKCDKPICHNCLSLEHNLTNGHHSCELEKMQNRLQEILIESQQKLDNLIANIDPIQKEVLEHRQKDEELAHEFILAKKRLCTKIIFIGEEIEKAKECLQRWSVCDLNKPLAVYQGILQQTKTIENLEPYLQNLKDISEGCSLQHSFHIQTHQGITSHIKIKTGKTSNDDDVDDLIKKLQKFIFVEFVKSCCDLKELRSEKIDKGNLEIFITIKNNPRNNLTLNRNIKFNSDKELMENLKTYFNDITVYNSHYKAEVFFSVFHIHLDNVTLMVDALLEAATSSFEHCTSLANFCVHIMNISIKTSEWQFISKSLPSFLLSSCQTEFLKDVYKLPTKTDTKNYDTSLEETDNDTQVFWKEYKCLIKFIGELFVCGLLKYSILNFFIENLMARRDDNAHYYECICILLFTVGSVLDMETETSSSLTGYLAFLEQKLGSYPNEYSKNLFQYLQELRKCHWSIRELSYSVNLQTTRNESEILDYLTSVEALALSLNQAVGL